METIPAALDTALGVSVIAEAYAEIIDASDDLIATLEITEGSVTQNFLNPIRRTCDFTAVGWVSSSDYGGIVPESTFTGTDRLYGDDDYGVGYYGDSVREWLRGLFLPLITRVRLYTKYTYDGIGSPHTVFHGTFTLDDPNFTDSGDGSLLISASGWDISGDLAMDRFANIYPFLVGDNMGMAIDAILTSYGPATATITLPSTTELTGAICYLPGGGKSPWQAARELAAALNWNLYATRDGNFVADELPAPGAYPAAVYDFRDDTNLLSIRMVPSARELCNRVIVYGENAENDPVYAIADDTISPYSYANIGRYVVREVKSELPTTAGQATNLANAMLSRYGRLTVRVEGDCLPCPHLEVGDTVHIFSDELELDDDFILEALTVPLNATDPTSFVATRAV